MPHIYFTSKERKTRQQKDLDSLFFSFPDPRLNPNIPKQFHIIWLGNVLPEKYLINLYNLAILASKEGFLINIWVDNPYNFSKSLKSWEAKKILTSLQKNLEEKYLHIIEIIDEVFAKLINIRNIKEIKLLYNEQINGSSAPEYLLSAEEIDALLLIADTERIGPFNNYAAASDIYRYLILYLLGGFYTDLDNNVNCPSLYYKNPIKGTSSSYEFIVKKEEDQAQKEKEVEVKKPLLRFQPNIHPSLPPKGKIYFSTESKKEVKPKDPSETDIHFTFQTTPDTLFGIGTAADHYYKGKFILQSKNNFTLTKEFLDLYKLTIFNWIIMLLNTPIKNEESIPLQPIAKYGFLYQLKHNGHTNNNLLASVPYHAILKILLKDIIKEYSKLTIEQLNAKRTKFSYDKSPEKISKSSFGILNCPRARMTIALTGPGALTRAINIFKKQCKKQHKYNLTLEDLRFRLGDDPNIMHCGFNMSFTLNDDLTWLKKLEKTVRVASTTDDVDNLSSSNYKSSALLEDNKVLRQPKQPLQFLYLGCINDGIPPKFGGYFRQVSHAGSLTLQPPTLMPKMPKL